MKMKEECLVIKTMNECKCENCRMWGKLRDMLIKHQIELEKLKENNRNSKENTNI